MLATIGLHHWALGVGLRRRHSKNPISSGVNVEPGPTKHAPASYDSSLPNPANPLQFLHDLCVLPFPIYERSIPICLKVSDPTLSDVLKVQCRRECSSKNLLAQLPLPVAVVCKQKEVRGDWSDTVDFLLLLYSEEEAWQTKEVTITDYNWSEGEELPLPCLGDFWKSYQGTAINRKKPCMNNSTSLDRFIPFIPRSIWGMLFLISEKSVHHSNQII